MRDIPGFLFTALVLGVVFYVLSCAAGAGFVDREPIKQAAYQIWRDQGFEVVAYEGWLWNATPWPGYGGPHVWHRLRKIPDNGVTYSGSLQKWGDEIHVYGPEAIDAIRAH